MTNADDIRALNEAMELAEHYREENARLRAALVRGRKLLTTQEVPEDVRMLPSWQRHRDLLNTALSNEEGVLDTKQQP